ncbi:hypothetical protein HK102_010544 [Quaeritorhiza haematococci]|nr:hypothetical protein HK102_010544 [Quaeritorhiza haematococci]
MDIGMSIGAAHRAYAGTSASRVNLNTYFEDADGQLSKQQEELDARLRLTIPADILAKIKGNAWTREDETDSRFLRCRSEYLRVQTFKNEMVSANITFLKAKYERHEAQREARAKVQRERDEKHTRELVELKRWLESSKRDNDTLARKCENTGKSSKIIERANAELKSQIALLSTELEKLKEQNTSFTTRMSEMELSLKNKMEEINQLKVGNNTLAVKVMATRSIVQENNELKNELASRQRELEKSKEEKTQLTMMMTKLDSSLKDKLNELEVLKAGNNTLAVKVLAVDKLTAENVSVKAEIAAIEASREELIVERNQLTAENVSLKAHITEVEHINAINATEASALTGQIAERDSILQDKMVETDRLLAENVSLSARVSESYNAQKLEIDQLTIENESLKGKAAELDHYKGEIVSITVQLSQIQNLHNARILEIDHLTAENKLLKEHKNVKLKSPAKLVDGCAQTTSLDMPLLVAHEPHPMSASTEPTVPMNLDEPIPTSSTSNGSDVFMSCDLPHCQTSGTTSFNLAASDEPSVSKTKTKFPAHHHASNLDPTLGTHPKTSPLSTTSVPLVENQNSINKNIINKTIPRDVSTKSISNEAEKPTKTRSTNSNVRSSNPSTAASRVEDGAKRVLRSSSRRPPDKISRSSTTSENVAPQLKTTRASNNNKKSIASIAPTNKGKGPVNEGISSLSVESCSDAPTKKTAKSNGGLAIKKETAPSPPTSRTDPSAPLSNTKTKSAARSCRPAIKNDDGSKLKLPPQVRSGDSAFRYDTTGIQSKSATSKACSSSSVVNNTNPVIPRCAPSQAHSSGSEIRIPSVSASSTQNRKTTSTKRKRDEAPRSALSAAPPPPLESGTTNEPVANPLPEPRQPKRTRVESIEADTQDDLASTPSSPPAQRFRMKLRERVARAVENQLVGGLRVGAYETAMMRRSRRKG